MDAASYRKIVEEFSDMATIIDADGKITYVSPAVKSTLGYDPEELIGEIGFEYQHPNNREAVAEAIESLQNNPEETEVIETRFRRADGSWCWIESTMQNRLEDDDIEGILVNSRDISERKHSEQEYQELATEYNELLERVKEGIFFLTVESADGGYEFRFDRVNSAYTEETGYTTEDLRGKQPAEVFGDALGAKLKANYHRCVKARKPISYQEELPVETGAQFWQTNLAPVITDGEVTQIIGITRNVTERVEREQTLQRHKTFLERSPVAIAVVDETGVVTYQSEGSHRVVGRPPEEILDSEAFEYIHPDDRAAVVETFTSLVEKPEESRTAEYRFDDGNGKWRWVRSTATNYLEEQAIGGIVISSVDITEQKEFEARIERQRDNLEVLNQVLRHDIRNDLQLVLNYAETLDQQLEGNNEYVDEILKSVYRANDITKSAKDVAEVMLGAETELHTYNLRNVLTDVLTDARGLYDRALITTEGTIPDVSVRGDEMIRSVFRNLVTNAIEHNDSAVPEVTVSVEIEDETVEVCLADNGPGISDARKTEIFEEGKKGLDSSSTGLGLYLVQTLVNRYNGDVWVQDNELEGATFGVRLPIAES